MTTEGIIQNRIIAEFEGWESNTYPNLPNIMHKIVDGKEMSLHINNFEYHSSWDWLMPVVEKISKHEIKGIAPFNSDQYVMVEIVPYGYVKISNLRDTPITTNVSVEGSLINAIYKAVVQFIQWYNDNLKNKQP